MLLATPRTTQSVEIEGPLGQPGGLVHFGFTAEQM
jgi:hypothetical protein